MIFDDKLMCKAQEKICIQWGQYYKAQRKNEKGVEKKIFDMMKVKKNLSIMGYEDHFHKKIQNINHWACTTSTSFFVYYF